MKPPKKLKSKHDNFLPYFLILPVTHNGIWVPVYGRGGSASIQYATFLLDGKQEVGDFNDIFHILYALHLTEMGHLQYPPL